MKQTLVTLVFILGASTALAGTSATCTQTDRGPRERRDNVQTASLWLGKGAKAPQQRQRKTQNAESQTRGS